MAIPYGTRYARLHRQADQFTTGPIVDSLPGMYHLLFLIVSLPSAAPPSRTEFFNSFFPIHAAHTASSCHGPRICSVTFSPTGQLILNFEFTFTLPQSTSIRNKLPEYHRAFNRPHDNSNCPPYSSNDVFPGLSSPIPSAAAITYQQDDILGLDLPSSHE